MHRRFLALGQAAAGDSSPEHTLRPPPYHRADDSGTDGETTMAGRMADRARRGAGSAFGNRPSQTRHPLVAVAMVLPLAVLFAVAFGGWEQVVAQASSVAGLVGR